MEKEVRTTYLEMNSPDEFQLKEGFIQNIRIIEIENEQFINMMLFCGVGLPWQWYSRLKWTAKDWQEYYTTYKSNLYIGLTGKRMVGYIELTHHHDNSIEIKFFGLFPNMIGKGLGSMLLSHAIRQAWSFQPERIWVHTCDLDGPAALNNYIARGFKIYREVSELENVPGKEESLHLLQQYFENYLNQYASLK